MYSSTLKLACNSEYKCILERSGSFQHNSEQPRTEKILYAVIITKQENLKTLQPFETSDLEMAHKYFNDFIKLNNLRIYS